MHQPRRLCRLSVAEAADLAGVDERSIQRAISGGRLPAQETIAAEGHHAGRISYTIAHEDLFRVYPAAQVEWERREKLIEIAKAPKEPAPKPDEGQSVDPDGLKDWQRGSLEARKRILRYLDELIAKAEEEYAKHSIIPKGQAAGVIYRFVADARDGKLPEEIQQLLSIANARAGDGTKRCISPKTIERWRKAEKQGAEYLAPKPTIVPKTPAWGPMLLDMYRQPQKPPVAWAVDVLAGMLPDGVKAPSAPVARKWLKAVGSVELQRGRMLPRELKTIRPFRRREKPEFPFDVLTADGHTFDAEVAHPEHGRPFRPELTVVVDVATCKVVGWSAGEKENAWVVVDALRQAIMLGGIPLIFYTDNGPGYKNERLASLANRVGFDQQFSIPYNSQARGVVERLQKTLWIDLGAKTFSTFVGASMDRQARQIVFKDTRKGVPVLPPWRLFVSFMEQVVEAYNSRPTRGLRKVLSQETGKLGHPSPHQAWNAFEAMGWKAEGLPLGLDDFRPHEIRKVRRGEISLYGNTYFNTELAELHGEEVRVAFDIHDANRVWIYLQDGRFVCEAGFEANKSAYFPKAYVDGLRERRRAGQAQRLADRAERVLGGAEEEPLEIEALTPMQQALAAEERAALGFQAPIPLAPEALPLSAPTTRAEIRSDFELMLWILAHPDQADPAEIADFNERRVSDHNLRTFFNTRCGGIPPAIPLPKDGPDSNPTSQAKEA